MSLNTEYRQNITNLENEYCMLVLLTIYCITHNCQLVSDVGDYLIVLLILCFPTLNCIKGYHILATSINLLHKLFL